MLTSPSPSSQQTAVSELLDDPSPGCIQGHRYDVHVMGQRSG